MKTKYRNILELVFLVPAFTFIGGVGYSLWQTRYLSEKFNKTELYISSQQLKEIWGEPDKEFDLQLSYDKRHIIKYNDFLGSNYIFTSEKGQDFITEKYIDD